MCFIVRFVSLWFLFFVFTRAVGFFVVNVLPVVIVVAVVFLLSFSVRRSCLALE